VRETKHTPRPFKHVVPERIAFKKALEIVAYGKPEKKADAILTLDQQDLAACQEIAMLRELNADLLAALEETLETVGIDWSEPATETLSRQIRAAIAKAKGA
jgi:hypothetical protein